MISETDGLIDFQKHDNGICELTVNGSARMVVDELFDRIDRIHNEAKDKEMIRLLIVQRMHSLPVRHTMNKVRTLKQSWSNPSRVVILTQMNPIVQSIVRLYETLQIKQNSRRFMPLNKRDEAIEWLLSE